MIGIEIDKQDQFREQSVLMLSQIEVQEIETAHKSVVSPCVPVTGVHGASIAWPGLKLCFLPDRPARGADYSWLVF